LSVHLRLDDSNQHIIGLNEFLLMKPTALFVNTANTALVDTEALITALGRGSPGLASIDVYDSEPIMQGHALLRLENTICTPHIANVDKDSIEHHYTIAFQHIINYLHQKPIPVMNNVALRYN
ncbi:MAG: NAD(P)-dependent oxidoreductase, partial [Saezia sp.]